MKKLSHFTETSKQVFILWV